MGLVLIHDTLSQSWPATANGILMRKCVSDVIFFPLLIPGAAGNALAQLDMLADLTCSLCWLQLPLTPTVPLLCQATGLNRSLESFLIFPSS